MQTDHFIGTDVPQYPQRYIFIWVLIISQAVPLLCSLEDSIHGFQTEFHILIRLTTGQFSTLSQSILNEPWPRKDNIFESSTYGFFFAWWSLNTHLWMAELNCQLNRVLRNFQKYSSTHAAVSVQEPWLVLNAALPEDQETQTSNVQPWAFHIIIPDCRLFWWYYVLQMIRYSKSS